MFFVPFSFCSPPTTLLYPPFDFAATTGTFCHGTRGLLSLFLFFFVFFSRFFTFFVPFLFRFCSIHHRLLSRTPLDLAATTQCLLLRRAWCFLIFFPGFFHVFHVFRSVFILFTTNYSPIPPSTPLPLPCAFCFCVCGLFF